MPILEDYDMDFSLRKNALTNSNSRKSIKGYDLNKKFHLAFLQKGHSLDNVKLKI